MTPASRRRSVPPDQVHRVNVVRQQRFYLTPRIAVSAGTEHEAPDTRLAREAHDCLGHHGWRPALRVAVGGAGGEADRANAVGIVSDAVSRQQRVRPRERRGTDNDARPRIALGDFKSPDEIEIVGGLMHASARPADRPRQQPSPAPGRVAPPLRNRRAPCRPRRTKRVRQEHDGVEPPRPQRAHLGCWIGDRNHAVLSGAGLFVEERGDGRDRGHRDMCPAKRRAHRPHRGQRHHHVPEPVRGADDQAIHTGSHLTTHSLPRSTPRGTCRQSGRPSLPGRASGGASTATAPGSAGHTSRGRPCSVA